MPFDTPLSVCGVQHAPLRARRHEGHLGGEGLKAPLPPDACGEVRLDPSAVEPVEHPGVDRPLEAAGLAGDGDRGGHRGERLGRVDLEVVGDGAGDEPVLAVQASHGHGARDPIERLSRLAPGVDVHLADAGLGFAELRERRVRDVQLPAEETPHRAERVGGQLAGRIGPEHLVGVYALRSRHG